MPLFIFILPSLLLGMGAYWITRWILKDIEMKRKIEFDKLHLELKKTKATITLSNRIKVLENQNKGSNPFGRKW